MTEEVPEVKPTKDINLILGRGRVVSAEEDLKKSRRKKLVLVSVGVASLLLMASVIVGWQSAPPGPSIKTSTVPTPVKPKEAGPTVYDPTDPIFWPTYTDAVNLFSLKYPRGTTVGKRPDNPFPVAVALKFNEAVVETTPRAEKPGWLLTVSALEPNDKNQTLLEWAKDRGLEVPEAVNQLTLDGREALAWRSTIYPESYYLIARPEGVVFVKVAIDSQQTTLHQQTIDKILASLKLFARENDPDLGLKWVRRQLGDSWDVEYPEGWTLDNETLLRHFGNGEIKGRWREGDYIFYLAYPLYDRSLNSLEALVDEDLRLNTVAESQPVIRDLKVSGVPGKLVLDYVSKEGGVRSHRFYIWKTRERNVRLVTLVQTEGEYDSAAAAKLLERFIAGIR